jgi:hypothetical protein
MSFVCGKDWVLIHVIFLIKCCSSWGSDRFWWVSSWNRAYALRLQFSYCETARNYFIFMHLRWTSSCWYVPHVYIFVYWSHLRSDQRYWGFRLYPSSWLLKNLCFRPQETDPVSETSCCSSVVLLITRTMDRVRKPNISESYVPSSESYSNYLRSDVCHYTWVAAPSESVYCLRSFKHGDHCFESLTGRICMFSLLGIGEALQWADSTSRRILPNM